MRLLVDSRPAEHRQLHAIQGCVDGGDLLTAQLDFSGPQVLSQSLYLAAAGDGHDVGFLAQHPGHGNLGGGGVLLDRKSTRLNSSHA